MSYYGRKVVEAIDERQRAHEEKLERDYWGRYAERLTPQERRRLSNGDYKAIARPVKPNWQPGDWLQVAEGLSVRIKEITFRRHSHRSIIDQVQDFRAHRLHGRWHEDPNNMVTIVPVNDRPPNPPEPERVPPDVQNVFVLEARTRWSGYMEAERTSEVAEQRAKQLTRRLRRLQADAVKHGVDIAPRLLGMIREAEAEVAKKRAA